MQRHCITPKKEPKRNCCNLKKLLCLNDVRHLLMYAVYVTLSRIELYNKNTFSKVGKRGIGKEVDSYRVVKRSSWKRGRRRKERRMNEKRGEKGGLEGVGERKQKRAEIFTKDVEMIIFIHRNKNQR